MITYRMIIKHRLKGIGTKKEEVFGTFVVEVFLASQIFDHLVECTRIRLDNKQNKIVILLTVIIKFLFNIKRL